MEFAQKIDNRASVSLATFLDHHECRLPRTVKLADGFCGTNEDDTLEADQAFVFHKVERQKTVVAIDQLGQEICMQQNSRIKVHLLPPECHKLYETVRELPTAQSSYFLVLEDIPSLGIVTGSKLILPSNQRSIPNYLKCQVVDYKCPREVLLPLHLTGRFLPLFDFTDYCLDEVLASNQLPVNIRFVSQSTRANDRLSPQMSLTSLGNIRLMRKTEVEMVFATSFDTTNELSLFLFPKTLDVTVSWGFKLSAEASKKVRESRQALELTEMSLKRLDNVIKGSFYFTACPVRRFSLRSLRTPPMPLPRPTGAEQSTPPSPLPRKLNSLSIVTDAQPEKPPQPVPKPRKRLSVEGKASSEGKMTKECVSQMRETQPQGGDVLKHGPTVSTEDNIGETSPELPKRPIFLEAPQVDNEEEGGAISDEDSPPPLPPKNAGRCPDQEHIENEESGQQTSPSETPPPLPVRNESFGRINPGLEYLSVDITDWKKIEENCASAYAEVKDDGRVFKQDDAGNSYIPDVIYDSDETEDCQVMSSDNNEYVECCKRKYVNHDILVENELAHFVNISAAVELPEISRYLHLGNPSDEEENVM